MRNYWSCTRFANWLRGTPALHAGTAEEWNVWRKKAREKKIRYWLAEESLDYVQNFLRWPLEWVNAARFYIKNRFISRTHQLTSRLKRGQYHEFDTRMLYCLFDELVNFVEVEQAWMNVYVQNDKDKPFFSSALTRIGWWRCPEEGLEYLHWASDLKHNEEWMDKDDLDFGKPTPQALVAQETILLYTWWKERPNRFDPMDASGLTAYYEEREKAAKGRGEDVSLAFFDRNESDESRERWRKLSAICQKMEQEQEDEDTKMLIRLVKIRRGLWT